MLPNNLRNILDVLHKAHPARVEPQSEGMKRAAHWAWSRGLALRHLEAGMPITYSISPSGIDAIREARNG